MQSTALLQCQPSAQSRLSRLRAQSEKSIAVLPFANMSSEAEQEYLSDGIAEQLLNVLAKIPELRVISRSSAFSLKGQNIEVAEIAKRLNVTHVLEGSVRKAGTQVRIAVQLIEARSDTHMWSETYDRKLMDIFAVQDEIALAVVHQLKLALLNHHLPARSRTANLEAYNAYLRGRFYWNEGDPTDLEKARQNFERALDTRSRLRARACRDGRLLQRTAVLLELTAR